MVQSKKQWRFMKMIENNPAMAKKLDVPQSVAKEFTAATPKKTLKKLPEKVKKK